jgi:CRISPR-associated protein Cas5d
LPYGVRVLIEGERALFTRPEMKVERVSYDVMTPSAARGILEAIHWKPAIRWVIDCVHVLKPIRFQSIRRNEVGHKASVTAIRQAMMSGDIGGLSLRADADRQQRAATILVDVAYAVEAHFVMTARADLRDSEGKHLSIFNRRAAAGQCFHQPCLGTREFPARLSLIEPDAALPEPVQDLSRDLGWMLWDIDHQAGRAPLFFRASLDRGTMRVPPPESIEIRP